MQLVRVKQMSWTLGFGVSMLLANTAWAAPPPPPPTNADVGREDPTVGARVLDEDVASAWGYSTGKDVEPNYTRPAEKKAKQLQINPIGYYQGVTVEGGNLPPFAPQELGTGASVLTWTGFESKMTQSRVFFQLSSPVTPEVTDDGLTLTYRLPNTSVNVRNNQRRLDTRYFQTPVTSVNIRRSGADTVITLKLRREVAPSTRVVSAPNGYSMFVIEFIEDTGPGDTAAVEQDSASADMPAS